MLPLANDMYADRYDDCIHALLSLNYLETIDISTSAAYVESSLSAD